MLLVPEAAIADSGLDVLSGVIEKASRTDKELQLMKFFDDSLAKAFNKASNSAEGGPDFPWWFPRPSYKTYEKRTIVRNDTDVSVIIDRSQGRNNEEHTIEYVLRKKGNIWKIFDVKELPGKGDSSDEVQSLRGWLGLK